MEVDGRRSFVGREAELGQLSELLARARDDVPGLVVVEGPPGIGKTSLVNRFLAEAGDARVLRASGDESEADLAFGVLTQLVAGAWSRGAGAVAALPSEAAGTGLDNGAIDPLTAGARFLEVLSELQRSDPVIVVVDDVQWADLPSLQALTFALRRLSNDRVLVVMTHRDADEVALHEGFRRLLANEGATRLALSGLDSDELRRLSVALGGQRLTGRGAARLWEYTAGNPLHARALLEQIPVETLQDAQAPLPAPRSFALLVLGQMAACSTETRQFVSAASVLGRRCAFHLVSQLSEVHDPLQALDEATEAGLLVESPVSRSVEFPHPLVHAAVYRQLGATRRVRVASASLGVRR